MSKEELTLEQKAINDETWKHIHRVQEEIWSFIMELQQRAFDHDQSKMESPEVEVFAEYTSKLKKTTYGTREYRKNLEEMGPALKHHYENNRHHPEHFSNGISGMTLMDIVEMLCDWKTASERHENGDIFKSIQSNSERFYISEQLQQILINTVLALWSEE